MAFVLVVCDATSLRDWCPSFGDNLVVSSPVAEMSSSLDTTLSRNVGYKSRQRDGVTSQKNGDLNSMDAKA